MQIYLFESFSLPRKTFHSSSLLYFWPFPFNYLIFSFSFFIHSSCCLSLVLMLFIFCSHFITQFFLSHFLNVNLCQPFHWPINWYQICHKIAWYIYIDYIAAQYCFSPSLTSEQQLRTENELKHSNQLWISQQQSDLIQ